MKSIDKRVVNKAGIKYDSWFGSICFVFDAIEPFLKEVTDMSRLHRLQPIQNVELLTDTHLLAKIMARRVMGLHRRVAAGHCESSFFLFSEADEM
jgi:hypothetical protein